MRIEESGYLLHPPYGNRYVAIQVDPTQWSHVCSARFGPGRPSFSKQTKWTGDSYRYDIFIRPEHRQIALRWFNGSGRAGSSRRITMRGNAPSSTTLPSSQTKRDAGTSVISSGVRCHKLGGRSFIPQRTPGNRRSCKSRSQSGNVWPTDCTSIKPQIIGLPNTVSTFTPLAAFHSLD